MTHRHSVIFAGSATPCARSRFSDESSPKPGLVVIIARAMSVSSEYVSFMWYKPEVLAALRRGGGAKWTRGRELNSPWGTVPAWAISEKLEHRQKCRKRRELAKAAMAVSFS